MSLRMKIRESLDDFDWIRDVKPSLLNKYIYFEPMIDSETWIKVKKQLMSHSNVWDENIRWWGGYDLKSFDPMKRNDIIYLHHLIIANNGRMLYGGMKDYEVGDMIADGYNEYEIINSFEEFDQDAKEYIEKSDLFSSPEMVDGRRQFNITNP